MNPAEAPFREAEFLAVDLDVERRDDGTIVIRSRIKLRDFDANMPRAFAARAAGKGDAPALGWRDGNGEWAYRSYAELKRDVDGATQWMLDHLPRGSALVVMAENSLAVAVLTFAAFAAGVVLVPVSVAYGMVGGDHARLRHVFAKTRPAAAFVDPHPALLGAVREVGGPGVRILTRDTHPTRHPREGGDPGTQAFPDETVFMDSRFRGNDKGGGNDEGGGNDDQSLIDVGDLMATEPSPAVAAAIDALDPDATAIHMLTSGSTGLPKVVPQSMRALAACGAQGLDMIGKAAGWDQAMLDWLPWHHAAGASVLRTCLTEGGTLHIDAGKPAPGLFDTSIANLREVSVAYFNNVPAGYAMLVDALEADPVLRASFFRKMRLMLYGGAGLPQHVYDRLQALAVAETGHRIHMTTGYGMTETVSGCMAIHFPTTKVGIGLPAPGLELKLVPCDGRYEVRLRGPNVMKSYLDEPGKNAEVFDEEGFYRTGDVAIFHDEDDPGQGLAFAGRLAEEFKLANGTWVYGGALRAGLLAALDGLVGDLVLADDGRPYLALIVWPKPGATLDAIAARVAEFNRGQRGGSATIRRVALFNSPPNPGAHEVSDKGTINRRAVLDHRAELVERVFAEPAGEGVVQIA